MCLRHHFMHREVRAKGIRTRIWNTESFQDFLYFSVFTIFTVKTIENDINLSQNALGRSRTAAVVPDSLSVYINITCRVSLFRKSHKYCCTGLKRDIMLVRRPASQYSDDGLHVRSIPTILNATPVSEPNDAVQERNDALRHLRVLHPLQKCQPSALR